MSVGEKCCKEKQRVRGNKNDGGPIINGPERPF